ncbi:MAG: alpha/beta fold hydrolase [Pedosphaera sp.]|nr:alpha/beta fold hydrolase [Pedosphaera sp.]
MRTKFFVLALLLVLGTTGCGSFMARRMAQAPNSYPQWLAPVPRVELAFADKFLTNFPAHFVAVGPPAAQLRYRIVEPADFQCGSTSTNWQQGGRTRSRFTFRAVVPGVTNAWTASPHGTVILLHGYGVGQFATAPWALRLAQAGWRCVLLDLRGHGKSTGRRIYFGVQEARDLSQLLDQLAREGQLIEPVPVLGDSYGAALALRWKIAEPRVGSVVAIAPYAHLSNAVVNICHDYANWMPRGLLRAGLRELPSVLKVERDELDPAAVLARNPPVALFVAGAKDRIAPVADVRELFETAARGSELLVVPDATHEALPYYFDELVPSVLSWLREEKLSATAPPGGGVSLEANKAALELSPRAK